MKRRKSDKRSIEFFPIQKKRLSNKIKKKKKKHLNPTSSFHYSSLFPNRICYEMNRKNGVIYLENSFKGGW